MNMMQRVSRKPYASRLNGDPGSGSSAYIQEHYSGYIVYTHSWSWAAGGGYSVWFLEGGEDSVMAHVLTHWGDHIRRAWATSQEGHNVQS